jgi:hypothetical protein
MNDSDSVFLGVFIGSMIATLVWIMIFTLAIVPGERFRAFQGGTTYGCVTVLEGQVAKCVELSRSLEEHDGDYEAWWNNMSGAVEEYVLKYEGDK